jgi:hypothetical protein
MMTIRINFSGVRSVNDPFRFVVTRFPIVEARLVRPSMFSGANGGYGGRLLASWLPGCELRGRNWKEPLQSNVFELGR